MSDYKIELSIEGIEGKGRQEALEYLDSIVNHAVNGISIYWAAKSGGLIPKSNLRIKVSKDDKTFRDFVAYLPKENKDKGG